MIMSMTGVLGELIEMPHPDFESVSTEYYDSVDNDHAIQLNSAPYMILIQEIIRKNRI